MTAQQIKQERLDRDTTVQVTKSEREREREAQEERERKRRGERGGRGVHLMDSFMMDHEPDRAP